jgi:hypothetical protein
MDLILILYSILFAGILVLPFLFLWKYSQSGDQSPFGKSQPESILDLEESREILLSNLRDLKAEEETGKLKKNEFQELARELFDQLAEIDQSLERENRFRQEIMVPKTESEKLGSRASDTLANRSSSSDKESVSVLDREQTGGISSEIHYCPNCGTKQISGANFCHSCGFDLKKNFPV